MNALDDLNRLSIFLARTLGAWILHCVLGGGRRNAAALAQQEVQQ